MADLYAESGTSLVSPASGAFAIVPDDATLLPQITRSLYIGLGGNLTVEMHWGETVTFSNLPSGALLPIRVRKVLAASTVTAIVGLY